MRKPILILALVATSAYAQTVSESLFDNFASNRTHAGSQGYFTTDITTWGCPGTLDTTNVIWTLICGSISGTYSWAGMTFSGSKMVIDHRRPNDTPVLNITGMTSGPGGRIRVYIANHDVTYGLFGATTPPVHVTGVTTCMGGTPDCDSTGYWLASGLEVDATSSMTGTNTWHSTGHGFVNGDTVWLANCIENPAMTNQKYVVANATANTLDLTGFSGTLCTIAHVIDNMRFDLLQTALNGTFGSPSGTATKIQLGMQVTLNLYPHASGGSPTDFAFAGNSQGGDFVTTANRVRFDAVCDYDLTFNTGISTVGPNGFNFGTYAKPNVAGVTGSQGPHFYHQFAGNIYANRTMHFEAMRKVQHSTSFDGPYLELMEDPTFITPFYGEFAPAHYWDELIEAYFQIALTGAPLAQGANGGICQFSNMKTAVVTGEVDTYVAQVQTSYTGTQYEVTWNQPPVIPSGIDFDVRYSTTGSFHTNGFSSGTSGGTVTGGADAVYSDLVWDSGAMAEAANLWVGIRPHMRAWTQTGNAASTIIVTPYGGHDLQDGDTVTVAGVTNVTNGTYPIDRIASIRWTVDGGHWSAAVVSSGIVTLTVDSTAGVYPGMGLSIVRSGSLDLDTNNPQHNRSIITEVTDSTHLKATTVAADGTYTLGASGTMATFSAISLRGTTPTGSAGSAGNGTVTPADSTRGFYEMQISSGAGPTSSAAASGGNFAAGGSFAK
jgi:hypothetical protein